MNYFDYVMPWGHCSEKIQTPSHLQVRLRTRMSEIVMFLISEEVKLRTVLGDWEISMVGSFSDGPQ